MGGKELLFAGNSFKIWIPEDATKKNHSEILIIIKNAQFFRYLYILNPVRYPVRYFDDDSEDLCSFFEVLPYRTSVKNDRMKNIQIIIDFNELKLNINLFFEKAKYNNLKLIDLHCVLFSLETLHDFLPDKASEKMIVCSKTHHVNCDAFKKSRNISVYVSPAYEERQRIQDDLQLFLNYFLKTSCVEVERWNYPSVNPNDPLTNRLLPFR